MKLTMDIQHSCSEAYSDWRHCGEEDHRNMMYQILCVILALSFLIASGQRGKLATNSMGEHSAWPSYRNYGRTAVVKEDNDCVPYEVFNKTMNAVMKDIDVLQTMLNKAIAEGINQVKSLDTRISSLETDNCENNPCQNGGTCHSLIGGHLCQCLANKYGASCERDVGSQVALPLLKVTNGEKWGFWYILETCPSGSFAAAFHIKLEGEGKADDSSCNGVQLLCKDLESGKEQGHVSSGVGVYGDWKDWQNCPEGSFLVKFKLKVEKEHGGDESAMNGITMMCRGPGLDGSSTKELTGPTGSFGDWGEYSDACPPGTVICGISSKIDAAYLAVDKSGMNDVQFQCCYI